MNEDRVRLVRIVSAPEVEPETGEVRGYQDDIVVALPSGAKVSDDDLEGSWRLDVSANLQAYSVQLQSLKKVAEIGRNKESESPIWDFLTAGKIGGANVDSWIQKLKVGEVNDVDEQDAFEPALEPSRREDICALASEDTFRRKRPLTSREDDALSELNGSQREAVLAAWSRRLTLVQGPPGTGKTHVAVKLLILWREMRVRPVLVTSHNNVAVDNIAESAYRSGLKVVRVGRPEKISEDLSNCLLSNYSQKQRVLKRADVICVTTMSSASGLLSSIDFKAIVMDEAAQATELSALVPIMNCRAERLVLVGDQCQLPANVESFEAQSRGLSLSLFSRLIGLGLPHYFLNTQFRMHPAIATFSSFSFYDGRLLNGVPPDKRMPPAGFNWPNPQAGVALLDSFSAESKTGLSWCNQPEADSIVSILTQVLSAGELSASDIGVVTPYVGQVRLIRKLVQEKLKSFLDSPRDLDIQSVDGFQGREKELILFSAVRSNRRGSVGFLADWRRLNVMVTRARRGLIVLGNVSTLRTDSSWASWIEWAQENGFEVDSSWSGGPQKSPARESFQSLLDQLEEDEELLEEEEH